VNLVVLLVQVLHHHLGHERVSLLRMPDGTPFSSGTFFSLSPRR
jgi:hypothetical protein